MSAIAEQFDGFILDLWGVVHNGVEPLPGSVDAMAKLREMGKKVALLSNAPRRVDGVTDKLRSMGVGDELYDFLLTSGEEAWQGMKNRTDVWYSRLGRKVYHLGKGGADKDADMRQGFIQTKFVDNLNEAEFVLLTGTVDPSEQIEDYENILKEMAMRQLPMICANPDLVVIRGETREICAGTLADYYADLGGDVRYHGKPHGSVYRTCCDLMELSMDQKVVGVGDSFRTDVIGAKNAGLKSVLVAGGIYADPMGIKAGEMPSESAFEKVAANYAQRPDFVMPLFQW